MRDSLSLWVIGPELGEFIAGIRTSVPGSCVEAAAGGWRYASREAQWEDDDPSLRVGVFLRSS